MMLVTDREGPSFGMAYMSSNGLAPTEAGPGKQGRPNIDPSGVPVVVIIPVSLPLIGLLLQTTCLSSKPFLAPDKTPALTPTPAITMTSSKE
jgi:hypothetical protein